MHYIFCGFSKILFLANIKSINYYGFKENLYFFSIIYIKFIYIYIVMNVEISLMGIFKKKVNLKVYTLCK